MSNWAELPAALGVACFQITALPGQDTHRTYSQHADSTDDRKQRHVHVYDGAVPWLNPSSVPAAHAKSNQGSESAQPACYKFTD